MLFFLIEQREDNIYDFFTIQKDCKVVWFTGCFAWGCGDCNTSVSGKNFQRSVIFIMCNGIAAWTDL